MVKVVVKDNITEWHDRVRAELNKLAMLQIRVGILGSADGELLRIAYVHEFGATITPRTARNLAIPLSPSARNKSPRDYDDAWVLDNGENRFLVHNKRSRDGGDNLEFLYLLVPKVTIPERSFIRAGYDAGKNKILAACEWAARAIVFDGISAEIAAERIGVAGVGIIKRYMRSGAILPKSSLTLASAPNKTKPLIRSGRLANAITYEVIKA